MRIIDLFWDAIWAAFLDDNEWWIKAQERKSIDATNPAR